MNADLSPALAASNTVETLAAKIVESADPTIAPNILEKAAGLVDTFDSLVKTEFDKVEAEAAKLETEVVAEVEKVLAPVETEIEAAIAYAETVIKAVERVFHPEVGVTRPVLNHTVLTSKIVNPA